MMSGKQTKAREADSHLDQVKEGFKVGRPGQQQAKRCARHPCSAAPGKRADTQNFTRKEYNEKLIEGETEGEKKYRKVKETK